MTLLASSAVILRTHGRPDVTSYGRWHSPTSVVCWGSVTKVFVAALTRSLVRDGVFSWDTPVAELVGQPAPGSMTIEALVMHRAGLPRNLFQRAREARDPYKEWTNAAFDAVVLEHLEDLAGPPGTIEYSDVSYAVLIRALEISQRTPWIDQLRTRVVEPLGLPGSAVCLRAPGGTGGSGDGSGYPPLVVADGVVDGGLAEPLVRSRTLAGDPLDDWDTSTGPFSGSDGLCSTVPDMVTLVAAAIDARSELDPRSEPQTWTGVDPQFWHRSALLRSGSIVLVDVKRRTVGVAHSVGGVPRMGAESAQKALARAAGSAGTIR